ncbi:MAG: hypothetical protein JWO77_3413 [Ilumatobacteraceae bacterium]|nr:hypothetical protein [Ilumatobacteraceae bacterium]
MGWRYSTTREAWVHRAFSGRLGPVFIDPEYFNHPGVTETVEFDATGPFEPLVVSLTATDHPPLPQRVKAKAVRRDRTRVRVRLSDADDTRVVLVDGKPPRRGTDPIEMRTADAIVVPIKSARATG